MALELLCSCGMIAESEERRLVGPNTPTLQAAIPIGMSRSDNRLSRLSSLRKTDSSDQTIRVLLRSTCDTDVEPFHKVSTSKRMLGKVWVVEKAAALVVMKEK